MKKFKIFKFFLLFMLCILGFNLSKVQMDAADKQNIVVWNETYEDGGTKEFSFHASDTGILFVDLSDTMSDDDYFIYIKDSMENILHTQQFDWLDDEDCSFNVQLSEGDYTIVLSADDYVEFSVRAYFDYEPSTKHPEFEISEELLDLYVGESAILTIKSEPEGALFDVEWGSSNPAVAVISANGTVVAKKSGSAIITAVVNGKVYV